MRVARWVFSVEIWSVVLISVATVATAWSAYQAHRVLLVLAMIVEFVLPQNVGI